LADQEVRRHDSLGRHTHWQSQWHTTGRLLSVLIGSFIDSEKNLRE
jgi:hypothetical protein